MTATATATKAVADPTMPVHLLAAAGDGQFAQDAKDLDTLARRSHGERLEMVSGAAHGGDILLQQPSVWNEVRAFIKKYG